MKYITLWWVFAKIRLLQNIHEHWAAVFFITGKFVRFILIGLIILNISDQVTVLNGYTQTQLIIVYLLFNLLDISSQFFYRGIYSFRNAVLYGSFDRDLLNPINPLFSAIMTSVDFLDLPLFLVTMGLLIKYVSGYDLESVALFSLMFVNGFLIVTGIHILVAAMAILFNTADQMIGIYRGLSSMAQFPIDIYAYPVRLFLNTVVPIGIAYTLPAQILFGKAGLVALTYGLSLGILWIITTLIIWRFALMRYSSASS